MVGCFGFCVQAKMRQEFQWPERISSNVTIKQEHNETICHCLTVCMLHFVYKCHFDTLNSWKDRLRDTAGKAVCNVWLSRRRDVMANSPSSGRRAARVMSGVISTSQRRFASGVPVVLNMLKKDEIGTSKRTRPDGSLRRKPKECSWFGWATYFPHKKLLKVRATPAEKHAGLDKCLGGTVADGFRRVCHSGIFVADDIRMQSSVRDDSMGFLSSVFVLFPCRPCDWLGRLDWIPIKVPAMAVDMVERAEAGLVKATRVHIWEDLKCQVSERSKMPKYGVLPKCGFSLFPHRYKSVQRAGIARLLRVSLWSSPFSSIRLEHVDFILYSIWGRAVNGKSVMWVATESAGTIKGWIRSWSKTGRRACDLAILQFAKGKKIGSSFLKMCWS